jgi:hypothetical protein
MTTPPRTYWVGSRFVAEWTLTDPAGAPITGATVTGTVSLPAGGTAPMTTSAAGNVYTVHYDATQPGTNAYRLVAAATGIDAHEDTFVVQRSLVGAPPITVDPGTDIGMVRLLATDLDEIAPVFEDAQITAFLAMEGTNIKRAAAIALETIAVSEVLISKVLTTSDGLTTDGAKVHDSLLKRAKALRDQADAEAGDPDDYGIEIVDYDPYAAYRCWG